jgi:hypothetical protein
MKLHCKRFAIGSLVIGWVYLSMLYPLVCIVPVTIAITYGIGCALTGPQ